MSFFKKAQQQIAHTSTVPVLGNQDLRALQDVISSEKDFIKTNTRAASDYKKNAEAIKAWSVEEGPDLNDVLGKFSVLMDNYTTSQNRFNTHLATVRLHFKSIRTREEALADLKSRKRSLGSSIERVEKKLSKMGPENKELMKVTTQLREMRTEMDSLRIEVMEEEAAIGDFKRRTTKEALSIKCGGLLEMAEKLTIMAEIGKLMLGEIPLATTKAGMPRAEYYGFAKTEQLLQEATRSIADVGFSPVGPSPGIPRYGNEARETDLAGLESPATHHDEGYNPFGAAAADVSRTQGSMAPSMAPGDVASTPIYATHASTSRWNADVQASTFDSNGLHDPAADEWGQNTREHHEGSAANHSGENGYDAHRSEHHPDAAYDGFMMQSSGSAQGAAPPQAQAGSPHQSVGNHQHAGDQDSLYATSRRVSAEAPQRRGTHDTNEGHVDHNTGIADVAATETTAAPHMAQSQSSAGYPGLGAPMLPPLRTSTPLPSDNLDAAVTVASPVPATFGAAASSYDVAPTTNAAGDSNYFQSVGGTRAHQEAFRRPTSSSGSAMGPGSRASTYGSLAAGAVGAGTPDGGKKVTAAAFRRGFNRAPSAQALPAPPAQVGHENTGATTPVPPGGYTGFDSAPGGGATPENEYPSSSSTQPLHIQKRNSAIGAAAAAGAPADLSGRRYSIEDVSGSDAPAPPYGYHGNGGNDGHEAPGPHTGVYGGHGGNQAPLPAPPATYGAYASPTAPPPPMYGNN
ncbi:uncharacterized protein PFL1_02038 [Pseudozyma flocculosa PF-1]|uniref:uncharacterized protein n=1 Tax=Pseudozyma flocculosa PF-1 TaxID=1277687 RepID=UPI0004561BE8|nr:uncharacterized protein PFL1_02038 [Pseudozyma flocculosa PF-1]EPQ30512.1 hypothetical protein PFL1_02038 [Pseudozyma flocculosa PF-1]